MSEKYVIRFWKDGEYELVDRSTNEQVKVGSLAEIKAYIELEEMGLL